MGHEKRLVMGDFIFLRTGENMLSHETLGTVTGYFRGS